MRLEHSDAQLRMESTALATALVLTLSCEFIALYYIMHHSLTTIVVAAILLASHADAATTLSVAHQLEITHLAAMLLPLRMGLLPVRRSKFETRVKS